MKNSRSVCKALPFTPSLCLNKGQSEQMAPHQCWWTSAAALSPEWVCARVWEREGERKGNVNFLHFLSGMCITARQHVDFLSNNNNNNNKTLLRQRPNYNIIIKESNHNLPVCLPIKTLWGDRRSENACSESEVPTDNHFLVEKNPEYRDFSNFHESP